MKKKTLTTNVGARLALLLAAILILTMGPLLGATTPLKVAATDEQASEAASEAAPEAVDEGTGTKEGGASDEGTGSDNGAADLDIRPDTLWVDGAPVPDEAMIDLPHYRQADDRWGEIKMGNTDSTIAKEGCALTSLSMYAAVFGIDEDPEKMNQTLGKDACPLEWEAFAAAFGLEMVHKEDTIDRHNKLTSRAYVRDTTVRQLAKGRPVIIGIYHLPSHTTHFVVAHGYHYEDGRYVVHVLDPSTNNDYQTLDDISDEWEFCRLVVYKHEPKN